MRRAAVSWGGQYIRPYFASRKYGISRAENDDLIRRRLSQATKGGWMYYNDAGVFSSQKEADIALAKKRNYFYHAPEESAYRRSAANAARRIRAEEKRKSWLTDFLAKKRMAAIRKRNAKRQQRSFFLKQIEKLCPDCDMEEFADLSTHNLQNYVRSLLRSKRKFVSLNKLSGG